MTVEAHHAGPRPAGERIPTLDAIRGVALLGILIMNLPGFASSMFAGSDGAIVWPAPWDRAAEMLSESVFSGKFNSMFSLLFGLGFTLQYGRLRREEPERATAIYLRRLAVLGALGAVHAFLIWPGDVLHIYALLGLLLVLPLRDASPRKLVVLMGLCLLYPVVTGIVRLVVMTPEKVAHWVAIGQQFEASTNAAFGHGSFWQAAVETFRVTSFSYTDPWGAWFNFGGYVMFAMTMLLGMLAGRLRWAERIPELMPRIPRLQWGALGIGLLCAAVYTTIWEIQRAPGPTPWKLLASVCYWTARPALMLFYVLTIVRVMQRPQGARRLAPVVAAGRMPLTNYLMQTLICTFIFYGWGLGFWGRVGPAGQLVLALAIFGLVQVPLSVWWIGRFGRGPLEALWARLTYNAPRQPGAPQRQGSVPS